MKSIVITGSTRGIGYGLADAFLARGGQVLVNGRSQQSVDQALAALAAQHGTERLHGRAGDVSQLDAVEALWNTAVDRFGKVDIWINNAGIGHTVDNVWELPPERVRAVVETDLIGLIYGCRVAIRGMLAQGHGQIYNMEGFGSDGRTRPGLSVYGSTKAAVAYLTDALTRELEDTPLQVGGLRPGMVITDFVMEQFKNRPEELNRVRGIFNIVADRPETVTPWLADQILTNDKHGTRIRWSTTPKLAWRFMTAPFTKRSVFDEEHDDQRDA